MIARKITQAYRLLFPGGVARWRFNAHLLMLSLLLPTMPGMSAGHNRAHDHFVERNIQFSSLSVNDGLAQVVVNTITQDHQGYIWFGTQEGLSRYNGYRFDNFYHDTDDPHSLSHEWIWSMLVDRKGHLWVGTDGGGLNHYDRTSRQFTHYMHDPRDAGSLSHDRVRVLKQASDGTLWIGTDGGGLNRFHPEHNRPRFIHYLHDPNQPTASLPDNKVLAIEEDEEGRLWIGTDGGGLACLEPRTERFKLFRHDPQRTDSLSSNRIRALYVDTHGMIWVGTEGGGLNLFDPKRGTFRHFLHDANDPRSLSNNTVHSILEDQEGTLWVGTSGGLNQWVPVSQSFLHYRYQPAESTSLIDDRVKVLMQDRGGVLWVGTNNGVNRWNYISDAFVYYGKTNDNDSYLLNPLVTAVDQTVDGHIWAGTYGGGLARIDPYRGLVKHYLHDPQNDNSLSSDEIMSLFVDRDNQVWAGTRKDGLNRLDPQTGVVHRYRHDATDPYSLAGDGITKIFGDADGTLWIATYGAGLNRMRPGSERFDRFRHQPEDPSSLSSDRVLTIYRDTNGTLYVGTENGGVNELDESRDSFRHYRHDPNNGDSLGSNTAWDILEDKDGSLWIGTRGGGLNRWLPTDRRARRNRFIKYDKQEGLISNTVQAILKEQGGPLWLSTNRGLTRLDPVTGHTRHFDNLNALKTNDFINGAKHHGHDGTLMFGSPEGLLVFHPDRVRSNDHPPPIVVKALTGTRTLVTSASTDNVAPEVSLEHTDYSVTFEFAALDFTSPEKNLFRYRLHGFDRAWVDSVQYHRATYTNLPADNYVFEVQAANNDGVWNEVGAMVELQILPPIWRSAWAYVLYSLIGIGLLGLFFYIQAKKSLWEAKQRARLEGLVKARTLELSDRNSELEDLNSKLKEASLTDSLTGLKNRRFFHEHIRQEVAWIDRRATELVNSHDAKSTRNWDSIMDECSLFFMMIDLDGFKKINDTHGHDAGDRALLQVCDILTHCCRSSDTVIRWGGDEFLIVGHSKDRMATEHLAERLRSELVGHTYSLGNGVTGKLSGSIGFAHYPFMPLVPGLLHWESVVGIADQAAYLAKQKQRNAWVGIYNRATVASARKLLDIRVGLQVLAQQGVVEITSSITDKLGLLESQPRSVAR
jgi:diguanylate cyclase (GGDEF)-like protein